MRALVMVAAVLGSSLASAQTIDQTPPKVIASEQLAKYWVMSNTSVDADVPNFGRNISKSLLIWANTDCSKPTRSILLMARMTWRTPSSEAIAA